MSGTAYGPQGLEYYVPTNSLTTLPEVNKNVIKKLTNHFYK